MVTGISIYLNFIYFIYIIVGHFASKIKVLVFILVLFIHTRSLGFCLGNLGERCRDNCGCDEKIQIEVAC